MLSKIASGFEQKFLFTVGRHFWNVVAVGGFVAMATGGVLALQGTANTQEEISLRKRIKPVPYVEAASSFQDWFNRKCKYYTVPKGYSGHNHNWWCNKYSSVTKSRKESNRYDRACTSVGPTGKTFASFKYVNGKCQGYEYLYREVDNYASQYRDAYYSSQDKIGKQSAAAAKIKNSNSAAEAELAVIEMEKSIKLGLGGIISAWGLGVVAASALNAALLAIERNTRRELNSAQQTVGANVAEGDGLGS